MLRGLSPRVRGSPQPRCLYDCSRGSIPACAGKPQRSARSSSGRRVYPRVCGEAYLADQVTSAAWGLSPRVRGSLHHVTFSILGIRSIPACAGKPLAMWACAGFSRVYPRVCGEASMSRRAS